MKEEEEAVIAGSGRKIEVMFDARCSMLNRIIVKH